MFYDALMSFNQDPWDGWDTLMVTSLGQTTFEKHDGSSKAVIFEDFFFVKKGPEIYFVTIINTLVQY